METFTIHGVKFLGHDALTFGDYGGAGSVGAANIRDIEETHKGKIDAISYSVIADIQELNKRGKDTLNEIRDYSYNAEWAFGETGTFVAPEIYKAEGHYGSETIYVRADVWAREEYERLNDYPLISDDTHSEIEMEWETEAFNSWAESDLLRDVGERLEDKFDTMTKEQCQTITWEAYRAAMEELNEYPTPEYNGSHIDVDRIGDAFVRHCIRILKGTTEQRGADLFDNQN